MLSSIRRAAVRAFPPTIAAFWLAHHTKGREFPRRRTRR